MHNDNWRRFLKLYCRIKLKRKNYNIILLMTYFNKILNFFLMTAKFNIFYAQLYEHRNKLHYNCTIIYIPSVNWTIN